MIKSKYSWKIKDKKPDDGFFKLAKTKGLTQTAAQLIYDRGIRTEEALDEFLTADLSQLHDPYLLHDMAKLFQEFVKLLKRANEFSFTATMMLMA